MTKAAKNSIILIHNHPSGSAFSPADFNTLNALESIRYMGIQGHNGEVYSLSVGDGQRFRKTSLWSKIENYFIEGYKKYKKNVNGTDTINTNLSKALKWKYRRGGSL